VSISGAYRTGCWDEVGHRLFFSIDFWSPDGFGAGLKPLRLGVAARLAEKIGVVFQAQGDVGMLGSQGLFPDCQGPPV